MICPSSETSRGPEVLTDAATAASAELLRRYRRIRATTEALAEALCPEDMVVQSMPDVSPTKWHLAHVTWFFERLALQPNVEAYRVFDETFDALFNSYYQSLGSPFPRARRGLLSRPTVSQILTYRRHVDDAVARVLEDRVRLASAKFDDLASVVAIGLQHEQQHQELLLMDIKNVFAANPLQPAYCTLPEQASGREAALEWRGFEGGAVSIGANCEDEGSFSYDNEGPRHRVWLQDFELASRPVSCGEYAAFIEDGAYERPELWLADGWTRLQDEGWKAPLYWSREGDDFEIMTLGGRRRLRSAEPVCHVSYYEADAYARWAGCRLPTEFEWERASEGFDVRGNFLEAGRFHPAPAAEDSDNALEQLFGDVWEWTMSPYAPYPGYEPFADELGEYNGKFMVNQFTLRGACCVTPREHARRTYRNFYYPHQRWMFAGFRLAR